MASCSPWTRLAAGLVLALVAAVASLYGSPPAELPRNVILLPALVLLFVGSQIMVRQALRR